MTENRAEKTLERNPSGSLAREGGRGSHIREPRQVRSELISKKFDAGSPRGQQFQRAT